MCRAWVALFAIALAMVNGGCNTSTCSRDPDEAYVPLAHNLNDPDAGTSDAEGGAAGDGASDGGSATDPALLEGSVTDGNSYWSAPVGGPYTYFPPFRTVTFEHDLGELPTSWDLDLAFSAHGTLAPSAGNMTELRNGEDAGAPPVTAQTFTVYNNTCSEFYLRVALQRPSR